MCEEDDISEREFFKIINTKGVARKLCQVVGEKKTDCTHAEFMSFILETSKSSSLDINTLENLHNAFLSHFGGDKKKFNFEDFKKIIPCKVSLLFHIYDVFDNGKLYQENFVDVLKACMKESSIKLDEAQVQSLANVLFEDGCSTGENYMTLECFKKQLKRQKNLAENLAMLLDKWVIPKEDVQMKKQKKNLIPEKHKRFFKSENLLSNKPLLFTIIGIIINH